MQEKTQADLQTGCERQVQGCRMILPFCRRDLSVQVAKQGSMTEHAFRLLRIVNSKSLPPGDTLYTVHNTTQGTNISRPCTVMEDPKHEHVQIRWCQAAVF